MNAVKHSGACHSERSRGVGVPARPSAPLRCAQDVAVALSAKTRADYRAAGFALRSLTRNAPSDPLGRFGRKGPLSALGTTAAHEPIDRRGQEGLSRPISSNISMPSGQDPASTARGSQIDFFRVAALLRSGSFRRLAPLLRKGVRLFDGLTFSRASSLVRFPYRGTEQGSCTTGSPHRGEPVNTRLIEALVLGQALVKHLGTFV